MDRKVVEAQQKLAELKRAQDSLERERASLEELRRRQSEFQTGRQEMIHNLTRGLGLLEEAEFNPRHEAEQMAQDHRRFPRRARQDRGRPRRNVDEGKFQHRADPRAHRHRKRPHGMEHRAPETSRAVAGEALKKTEAESTPPQPAASPLASLSFGELCKIGLAMTWPLVLVALGALGVFIAILVRH